MAGPGQPSGKPGTPNNPLPESAAGHPAPAPSAAPTAPTPGHAPAPTPAVNAPPSQTQSGTEQPLNPGAQPTDPPNARRTVPGATPGTAAPPQPATPPITGGPAAGRSPQQMAEDAARRQQTADDGSTQRSTGLRLGMRDTGEDITVRHFVDLFRTGVNQLSQHDYWHAIQTAGELLHALGFVGHSQNTMRPMVASTDEHRAEVDDFGKAMAEFQKVKGQVTAEAPQFAANPGLMQSGGPASGAAPGMAAPDKRTVGFDPNNIMLILQVFQTVADMLGKFLHRQ